MITRLEIHIQNIEYHHPLRLVDVVVGENFRSTTFLQGKHGGNLCM